MFPQKLPPFDVLSPYKATRTSVQAGKQQGLTSSLPILSRMKNSQRCASAHRRQWNVGSSVGLILAGSIQSSLHDGAVPPPSKRKTFHVGSRHSNPANSMNPC